MCGLHPPPPPLPSRRKFPSFLNCLQKDFKHNWLGLIIPLFPAFCHFLGTLGTRNTVRSFTVRSQMSVGRSATELSQLTAIATSESGGNRDGLPPLPRHCCQVPWRLFRHFVKKILYSIRWKNFAIDFWVKTRVLNTVFGYFFQLESCIILKNVVPNS